MKTDMKQYVLPLLLINNEISNPPMLDGLERIPNTPDPVVFQDAKNKSPTATLEMTRNKKQISNH